MTWDYPDPFTLPVAPLGGDIDHFNHTNNAVYIQWCERVGWGHSEALGLRLADYQRLDRAMVIRQAAYDYLLPTVLHEELTLATWLLGSDGKLAMQRGFQIRRNRDGATVLRGRWELVCVELSTGRPRRMPPEFCEIYLPAITPQVASCDPA
ncbi:MAG: thioesterase family protein [Rhodoferax sp.]